MYLFLRLIEGLLNTGKPVNEVRLLTQKRSLNKRTILAASTLNPAFKQIVLFHVSRKQIFQTVNVTWMFLISRLIPDRSIKWCYILRVLYYQYSPITDLLLLLEINLYKVK